MDIFNIIMLCGGLAFFLYGMHIMSTGLTKLTGGKLERTLKKMTSNPWNSLLLGAGITIAIQSSSAMTVMLVGLVNSGVMQLGQTIGVIMGSNIGTTLTAWILALTGLESDNVFMQLLKPDNFSPIFALVGILMIMGSQKSQRKDLGAIFVGFSILMTGMSFMSDAVSPLADMPQFSSILTAFKNPILGVLVGAVFTGIIQSSAASVGILQALALTGAVTYGAAIPIIMGQNIGTCVTAIISSIGVNRNAKRVAAVHISFNIIGTIIFLALYLIADLIFKFPFIDSPIDGSGIAFCHSIFNIATTFMLLPFTKMLENLACRLVPGRPEDQKDAIMLDERLLRSPSFAVAECCDKVVDMSSLAHTTVLNAISLFKKYDSRMAETILAEEERLDEYEDVLGTYLVKVSCETLSTSDSQQVSKCLHTIGDLERIGDHAKNIVDVAQEMHDKRIVFSEDALRDLEVINAAVSEVVATTVRSFAQNDLEMAKEVEPLEDVIDELIDEAKSRHIARLQHNACTIELGFVFTDYLTNMERISDHCSNVAVCLLEVSSSAMDAHSYLSNMKEQPRFKELFSIYRNKYQLP
ncbi:MAG: Na/Pi cotransporter family protein [Candidatus Heteroscillospira sp.]|jgi:phosphate:Na+ symporter